MRRAWPCFRLITDEVRSKVAHRVPVAALWQTHVELLGGTCG